MEKFLLFVLLACLGVAVSSESNLKDVFSKYKFHFRTEDAGEHTRKEESDENGRVIGMYSYKDGNGVLRTVQYRAAPELGYQAYGEGFPQFGSAPSEYFTNVIPTHLPVAHANTENKINESISEAASEVFTVTETPVDDVAPTSPASNGLLEIESRNSAETTESSAELSTVSPDMNNRLVPVLLPYGSFHKILIHSGHLYYTIPQALAYNFLPPNYRMVL